MLYRQRTMEACDVNRLPTQAAGCGSGRAPAGCILCCCAPLCNLRARTRPELLASRSDGRYARSLPELHRYPSVCRNDAEISLLARELAATHRAFEPRKNHGEHGPMAIAFEQKLALMLARDCLPYEAQHSSIRDGVGQTTPTCERKRDPVPERRN